MIHLLSFFSMLNHNVKAHMFSHVDWVFFASTGTIWQPVLKILGLLSMPITSISIVLCVKLEIILLQFQMRYLFLIPENQPSAVPLHVLNKEMFIAPKGTTGTRDH